MDSRLRLDLLSPTPAHRHLRNSVGTLFQPFTQVDASTTPQIRRHGRNRPAICKRLVNLMGGDIRVESVQAQGRCSFSHHRRSRPRMRAPHAHELAAQTNAAGGLNAFGAERALPLPDEGWP